MDQWDFFGVPRSGELTNSSTYGEAYFIRILIEKLAVSGVHMTRTCANLGANDGISGDPTHALFASSWSGLVVEPSKEENLWRRLWTNVPWPRVVKDNSAVTPDNVLAIFRRAGLPHDLDVLKIDLDSYDIFVVERIVLHSAFRPKILVMEINEKIPPPVMFGPNFRRQWNWKGDHFFASSASMIARTLKPLGYRSVAIDWNNMYLVDERNFCEVVQVARDNLEEQFALGYKNRKDRSKIFSWNENVATWLSMTDDLPRLLRAIHDHMANTRTFRESADATFALQIDPHYISPPHLLDMPLGESIPPLSL